ncbi:MAG: toprim domain-containing protein [Bacteroidota bacterium]
MTIPEIKSRLSMASVLAHYGLEAKGQNLACPFHDDEKASMRVYPDTNTVYCFAGSCAVEHLDVIDFIMQMDKSTKRAAILKAKSLCGELPTIAVSKPEQGQLDLAAIYEASLLDMERRPIGKAYCDSRGLDRDGIGYRSRKSKERWGRGCIIFPLVDKGGVIQGLYGRAVKGGGHYYTSDRGGLYPEYPEASTRCLLLTESVIDAASILGLLDGVTVLALYGTNGLAVEHRLEIKSLAELNEVVLALDGDEAGRRAAVAISKEIQVLRPGIRVTTLDLPEGEDLNGMWVSHADQDGSWLRELFAHRRPVGSAPPVGIERKVEPSTSQNGLTNHVHYLEYLGGAATYRIRGGIRGGAGSLKVTSKSR